MVKGLPLTSTPIKLTSFVPAIPLSFLLHGMGAFVVYHFSLHMTSSVYTKDARSIWISESIICSPFVWVIRMGICLILHQHGVMIWLYLKMAKYGSILDLCSAHFKYIWIYAKKVLIINRSTWLTSLLFGLGLDFKSMAYLTHLGWIGFGPFNWIGLIKNQTSARQFTMVLIVFSSQFSWLGSTHFD